MTCQGRVECPRSSRAQRRKKKVQRFARRFLKVREISRDRSQNRTRKAGNHEPTASQMVFVGTRFSIGLLMQPGKSSRTTVLWERVFPDNWTVVRLDFPGCISSPMEKRVPSSIQLSGSIFPAALVVRWKNAFPHCHPRSSRVRERESFY